MPSSSIPWVGKTQNFTMTCHVTMYSFKQQTADSGWCKWTQSAGVTSGSIAGEHG